ncbi:transporter substrate-binding domain-containing protein [Amycolatopsis sp. K13G38]|uniref:Transporter substrate-binding domain-containing protein n=1 Tax=Amycolatopsis acididurans TaxID=2724524 RepID=A0ABX1JIE9_9PSEU|nr:transporter substrate-binding domain-containing protein [Amycolatopsis acididurans]NKQ59406.1 transporter substrate-binding domain-containing protein [Amycolatopsis acididurans]
MNLKIRRACAVFVAAAAGLVATACGNPPASGNASEVTVQAAAEVVALVPDQIKQRGTLRVAIPDIGLPLAVKENGELRGMDPALGQALAQVMGLKYEPEMIPFAQTLPGLQADRYDVSFGEYYVTADRMKVVDFVTDWRDFSSFIVAQDAAVKPKALTDVCGLPIGAMDGSVELKFLNDAQAACAAQGKQPIAINAFPSISAGVLALSSNRVQGVLVGRGAGESAIAKGQPFSLVGEIGGGPTATAVARTAYSAQMLNAVRKAYETLIANGAYARILQANNTSYGAIDNPTIYTSGSTLPVYQ